MPNYKITITYDGTAYHGWQVQPNGISIQETLEEALQILCKKEIRLIGSGRTDAGVHALGQCANFHHEAELDLRRFLVSLNALIPPDIRVKKIVKAADNFHSQYSATGKIYHYHICLDRFPSPFKRLYTWNVFYKLDLDLLKKAAQQFVGTHDFTSFANEAHSGSASIDPIRTLYRLDIVPEDEGFRLEFEADGFLYKMVRNITGLLVEVAAGKRPVEDILKIFEKKDRRMAGIAAPPQGLFLVEVHYPNAAP